MSGYLGDFKAGQVVRAVFNTYSGAAPASLVGGSLVITKDGVVVTPSGGATLTVDGDSVTGFNRVTIDTSVDTSVFTPGADYKVRLGAGTVGGNSVVGVVVAEFSIQNRSDAILATAQPRYAPAKASDLPADYAQRAVAPSWWIAPSSTDLILGGLVVAGSTASSVIVSGLPAGKTYLGQRLYHQPSAETRIIATQSFSGGNYTFGFTGTAGTEAAPFSAVQANDPVFPIP